MQANTDLQVSGEVLQRLLRSAQRAATGVRGAVVRPVRDYGEHAIADELQDLAAFTGDRASHVLKHLVQTGHHDLGRLRCGQRGEPAHVAEPHHRAPAL